MTEINSQAQEQIKKKIIEFIFGELKIFPKEVKLDLVINKGRYILNSEQIHTILARIADDTGISMVLLRDAFPYDLYFITTKIDAFTSFGVFFIVLALILFCIVH